MYFHVSGLKISLNKGILKLSVLHLEYISGIERKTKIKRYHSNLQMIFFTDSVSLFAVTPPYLQQGRSNRKRAYMKLEKQLLFIHIFLRNKYTYISGHVRLNSLQMKQILILPSRTRGSVAVNQNATL